jgi:hypothetical protein
MPSKWIEFVKKWAKDNNITYGCAMSKPECKNAYHKKYDTQKYQRERKEKESEQMGAEEHFDFITANVLFYNYSEGFKVYQNNQITK